MIPTVGDIRKAIAGLPDSALVQPAWQGEPGKYDPAIAVHGFFPGTDESAGQGGPYLGIYVSLVPLDDLEAEDDDADQG